jgi:hypothetical protein
MAKLSGAVIASGTLVVDGVNSLYQTQGGIYTDWGAGLGAASISIRNQGGLTLANGDTLYPDPVLVWRSEAKLRALALAHSIERWSTNLAQCLANPDDTIYFDAQTTTMRADGVRKAIAAGKHIYCEKPIAADLATGSAGSRFRVLLQASCSLFAARSRALDGHVL